MNIDFNKYIIPISHCVFIDGAKRSIIFDMQRGNYEAIPIGISKIIKKYKGKKIKEVYEIYGIENKEVLDDYFRFLIENEYVFLSEHVKDVKRFSSLNTEYNTFCEIGNAIINLNENNKLYLSNLIAELEILNCNYIQIRIYNTFQFEELKLLISKFEETEIRNIEIILPYFEEAKNINFEMFFVEFQRLGNIVFYNSPTDNFKNYLHGLSSVHFVSYDYTNPKYCGAVNVSFFTPNQPHYIESQLHNTCLNRKICIDAEGEIKNCPSMQQSFGNIKDTTLKEAIEKPGFKDLWFICKDKIDVCKDCEFRHMCTDCRAFIKDSENIYSQPAKCHYNPYIAKWQGEEGYVPVEECGTYTKETGFVVDKKKVKELNKKIWG